MFFNVANRTFTKTYRRLDAVENKFPQMIKKWRGFFILSRPVNVAISCLSICVAIAICGWSTWENVLFACLTGGCLTAAANAINDFYDLEIDRINRPKRPLPSGAVTRKEAFIFSTVFFLFGVTGSALINQITLIIALIFAVLLYLYSSTFKRQVLIGNFIVSLATAFAFIFGGAVVQHMENAVFPAVFSFLLHFGREIIKDMEDVKGDQRNGAQTLPIRYGLRSAQVLTTVFLIALIVITQIPYFLNIYGIWYLIVVNLGVNTVVLYAVFSMWRKPFAANFRILSAMLKANMVVGLAAIYVGGL